MEFEKSFVDVKSENVVITSDFPIANIHNSKPAGTTIKTEPCSNFPGEMQHCAMKTAGSVKMEWLEGSHFRPGGDCEELTERRHEGGDSEELTKSRHEDQLMVAAGNEPAKTSVKAGKPRGRKRLWDLPVDPKFEVVVHIGDLPYSCKVCAERFADLKDFVRHSDVHSEKELFVCCKCNHKFDNQELLEVHLSLHSRDGPFLCNNCNKKFVYEKSFLKHKCGKRYICEICGKDFKKMYNLKMHLVTVHPKGEASLVCLGGGDKVPSRWCLRSHVNAAHPVSDTFTNNPHTDSDVFPESPKPGAGWEVGHASAAFHRHVCGDCGKFFATRQYLRRHAVTHSAQRTFVCDVCCKSFRRSGNLATHKLTHTNVKPHQCELCGKSFRQACRLRTHVLMAHNTSDRPVV